METETTGDLEFTNAPGLPRSLVSSLQAKQKNDPIRDHTLLPKSFQLMLDLGPQKNDCGRRKEVRNWRGA